MGKCTAFIVFVVALLTMFIGLNISDSTQEQMESSIKGSYRLKGKTSIKEFMNAGLKANSVPVRYVYVSNITNEAEFKAGARPNVSFAGPYVLREFHSKQNVSWDDEERVTYIPHIWYELDEELTEVDPDGIVALPNIGYMGMLASFKAANTDERYLSASFATSTLSGIVAGLEAASIPANVQWGSNAAIGAGQPEPQTASTGIINRCIGSSLADIAPPQPGYAEFSCYAAREGGYYTKFDAATATTVINMLTDDTIIQTSPMTLKAGTYAAIGMLTAGGDIVAAYGSTLEGAFAPLRSAIAAGASDAELTATYDAIMTAIAPLEAGCSAALASLGGFTCTQIIDLSNYLNYIATKWVWEPAVESQGGGLVAHMTAREAIVGGWVDPLIALIGPGLLPDVAILTNLTFAEWENSWRVDPNEVIGLNRGIDKLSLAQNFEWRLNAEELTMWGETTKVEGTNGRFLYPTCDPWEWKVSDLPKHMELWMDAPFYRPTIYDRTKQVRGRFDKLDLVRFRLNAETGIPRYAVDNSTNTNSPSGMVDIQAAVGSPLYYHRPHCLYCDQTVQDTTYAAGMNPTQELHDSTIDVEPVTGMTFMAHVRVAISAKMEPSAVWASGLPSESYVPWFWLTKEAGANEKKVDDFVKTLASINQMGKTIPMLLYIMGGCMVLIAFAVFGWSLYKDRVAANKISTDNVTMSERTHYRVSAIGGAMGRAANWGSTLSGLDNLPSIDSMDDIEMARSTKGRSSRAASESRKSAGTEKTTVKVSSVGKTAEKYTT